MTVREKKNRHIKMRANSMKELRSTVKRTKLRLIDDNEMQALNIIARCRAEIVRIVQMVNLKFFFFILTNNALPAYTILRKTFVFIRFDINSQN